MRRLDAIHIASVRALEDELDALVSYDERMLTAARALGVPCLGVIITPSSQPH